ncbi:hypothetical protein Pla175_10490 [Pirellulimonas nuda]|uniref:DUF1570 domain-containing protein n=1 Tax=Pirellulimonas nuda TaxID=2528009 RepID=A0A518D8A2_9BACT|nr:DUF1570 domain-containing protein [Pirellulimonas nuda]QDU87683.1 hypothetical protein Pla175_10490 [Pirellulimonas nuda]
MALLRQSRLGRCVVLLAAWGAALGALAAEPAGRWIDQRQVGPFAIAAEFDLSQYEPMLAELPALEREIRRVLATRPCNAPVTVMLAADEDQHRAVLAARFPGLPYRRALYVKQGAAAVVFAYRQPELAVDLRHECTHALLHADLAMLPLWLDEGLAEYFEPQETDRAFGHPHAAAICRELSLGRVHSVAQLEANTKLEEMSAEEYRSAWAWTHFMLHGPPEASEALWGFIASIRRGEPPGRLSARLASRVPDLQGRFARHFRYWPQSQTASERVQLR